MPSTYAHFRFGRELREQLAAKESPCAAAISAYPELFQIGLHGPDIFFYYRPLSKNPVKQAAHEMHNLSGAELFTKMKEKLARLPEGHRTAATAYLYGFICHFALDSTCHGYVDAAIRETGCSHLEIESEMDRALLIKDGLDPISQPLTGSIAPTLPNASVISRFFDGISAAEILESLKTMVAVDKLFLCPRPAKRKTLQAGLKLIGQSGLTDMMINVQPNPACTEAVGELCKLYEQALPVALRLIEGFAAEDALQDAAYCLNFESQIP